MDVKYIQSKLSKSYGSRKFRYKRMWEALHDYKLGSINRWIDARRIPIATLKPYHYYEGVVPDEDIVSIPFDAVDLRNVEREARNILILGGSGDGKSLIAKNIWWFLHYAGYYCIYVDPKSTDSGNASIPWRGEGSIAPDTKAKGIPLNHYIPPWAIKPEFKHLAHNFRKYSNRIDDLTEIADWQTLGMTETAASKTASLISEWKESGEDISLSKLQMYFFNLSQDKDSLDPITGPSIDSALRILTRLSVFKVVDSTHPKLDMLRDWYSGKSICLSYNSAAINFMAFDIGSKIKESAMTYFSNKKRKPIMWFLDDASFYAKESKLLRYNLAVEQIKKIGNDYRSLGVYNTLMVQSLGIIDEDVADTYKIKFISPLFNRVDQLSKINIPLVAIEMLKSDELVIDKSNHILQWILIDEDKNVIPCFPLTPPCNHFIPVYQERDVEVA